MELIDYLINVVEIEESELLSGEPAFTFSLEKEEEDKDE